MLRGVVPIVLMPFTGSGEIDERGLRNVVRFELEGGVDGLGVNGFATEAYKLTDDERRRAVEIVAGEVAGEVPLVIGLAPGSTEAAIEQANALAGYAPAALMVLPPATMDNGPRALVEHYLALGRAVDAAIMVQQSPHVPQYAHCGLEARLLAEMAERSEAVRYFKIEGPGAPERIADLQALLGDEAGGVGLFGGGGGVTFPDELNAGADGVIPGVGFNEVFVDSWRAHQADDPQGVARILTEHQPLVDAVSGRGHEFSLHARKALMHRAGYIDSPYVRAPTVAFTEEDATRLFSVADGFELRLHRASA